MAVRFSAATQRYLGGTISGSVVSFTCWAYITTDRNDFSNITIAYNGAEGAATELGLGSDTDGTTMLLFDSVFDVMNGPNMTVGTWYCFGVVANGTAWSLYYGTSPNSLTTVNATRTAISSPTFSVSHNGEWINGRVAAWKMWTAALTVDEIREELNQYLYKRSANLRSFNPFINAEVTDYSGNGNTLTQGTGATTEPGPPIPWSSLRQNSRPQNVTATAVIFTKTGGAAGTTAGSGPKNITFGKTGGGAGTSAGSGPKNINSTKTGGGATAVAGGGPKTRALAVRTGAGATEVAGSSTDSLVSTDTGSAATGVAGSGSRTLSPGKTGGGVTTTAGSGGKTLSPGKTGGGAATSAGSGERTISFGKAGGGASTTAGTGARLLTLGRTGGAATGTAGNGSQVVSPATTYTKAGGGAAGTAGTGTAVVQTFEVYNKVGSAASALAGSGTQVVDSAEVHSKTGGAVASGAGSGFQEIVSVTVYIKVGAGCSATAGSGSSFLQQPTVYLLAGGAAAGVAGCEFIEATQPGELLPVPAAGPQQTVYVYVGELSIAVNHQATSPSITSTFVIVGVPELTSP